MEELGVMAPNREHISFIPQRTSQTWFYNAIVKAQTLRNCLTEIVLRGFDSTGVVRHNTTCCSVCSSGEVPREQQDILQPSAKQYRKRPHAVRVVSSELMVELEVKLQQERDAIIAEKPSFRILGPQYVCCNCHKRYLY